MKTMRILAASLAVTLVSLLAAPSAEALSILLESNGDVVIVTDGDANDTAALTGIVATSATVGDFQVVLTAGFSDPITGSPSSPLMIFNIEAYSTAAGVLNAFLSDDNFANTGDVANAALATPPPVVLGAPLPLATSSVTYATFYGASNTEFDLGTLLTLQNTPGFDSGLLPSGVGPYSLTQAITIDNSTLGVSTAAATLQVPVPDGGLALSLLGFALVGVEGLRRRFKK
jgi:hypothetical protein